MSGALVEDAQELGVLRFLLQLGAGVGDGDEVVGGVAAADDLLHALEEVAHERVRLGRRAGFRGHDEDRLGDVERLVERLDLLRVGRVEHVELRVAGPLAERLAQDVGRERAAAHAQHRDVVEALGDRLRPLGQLARGALGLLGDVDPAQRVLDDRDVLGLARPRLGVVGPQLAQEVAAGQPVERVLGGLLVRAQRQRDPRRRAVAQLVELAANRVEHGLERVGERLHAVGDEPFGDVVERDLGLGQRVDGGLGRVDVLLDGVGLDGRVVEDRFERVGRHGVDRVLADQRLDVHQVGVGRVLDRGRGPERALDVRAALAQLLRSAGPRRAP